MLSAERIETFLYGAAATIVLCLVGYLLWPHGVRYDETDIASARRAGGDSATAEVSTRYLNDLVAPMQDTIAALRAKPLAAAKIVVRHDTVYRVDTTIVGPSFNGDSTVHAFPDLDSAGVIVTEQLHIAPAISDGTSVTRRLGVTIRPDTILAAFLRLPDGSERFSAMAQGQGYVKAEVVDAARRSVRTPFLSKAATLAGTGACAAGAYLLTVETAPWWALGSSGVVCAAHIVRELRR